MFLRKIPEVLSLRSLCVNTMEKSESQNCSPKAAVQFNAAANTTAAHSESAAVYAATCSSVIGKHGGGWETVTADGRLLGQACGEEGADEGCREGFGVNKERKGVRYFELSWFGVCFSHLCMVLLRGDN